MNRRQAAWLQNLLWLEQTSFVALPPELGLRPREFQRAIRDAGRVSPGRRESPRLKPMHVTLGLVILALASGAGALMLASAWLGVVCLASSVAAGIRINDYQPEPDEPDQSDEPRPEVTVSPGFSYPPMPRPPSKRAMRWKTGPQFEPTWNTLADVDISRVITIRRIPEAARDRFKHLVTLANHVDASELPGVLERLYREASEMAAEGWRDPLHELANVPTVASVATARGIAPTELWQRALAAHDAVELEWTELLLEPLAVLDHPMLLDVTQPATAAFVTAYAEAQDFRAAHGREFDPELAMEYADLSRRAAAAWAEAKARAKEAGITHLAERDRARFTEAMHLLKRAEDDALPVRQRVRATSRAARLLAKVESMQFPPSIVT